MVRTSMNCKLAITCLIGLLICAGCSALANPDQEFAMTLNGAPYWANHDPASGFLVEMESGMNLSYRAQIVFPLAGSGQVKTPGLEIEFDPSQVITGEDITFDAKSAARQIQVSYYPALGHKYEEGQLLVFSLSPAGRGVIRFEQIEARYGGRVKGVLRQVTLYGYYESGSGMGFSTPAKPMELKLQNFPFDVILEEAWW